MEVNDYPMNQNEDCWRGKLADNSTIFLHFQLYNAVPGPHSKRLVVGEIIYDNAPLWHKIIGYRQNSGDSLHLYEFGGKGVIVRELSAHLKQNIMTGTFITPPENKEKTAFRFQKQDTLIASQAIQTSPENIFGTYRYDFGEKNPEGTLTFKDNGDGTMAMEIYSEAKDGSGYVDVSEGSLKISGTSFIYDAQAYGVTIYTIRVQCYKDFAVINFAKPSADAHKFGKWSTAEGIFYKVKEP